ncbi:hypothetical protein N7526_007257 [Penicillium atrosanguineum]|nr:hypothetical protein N7526_007257 [Penicillium atrosanguineum]
MVEWCAKIFRSCLVLHGRASYYSQVPSEAASWPTVGTLTTIIATVTLVLLQLSFLLLRDRSIKLPGATSVESLGGPVSNSPVFHNGSARHVAQQLANLTEAYTSHAVNSSVGLVLASLRSDDLTWLLDYCHERVSGNTPFIYTTEKTPEPGLLVPSTLRGRESPAYLSYVVDFYDRLPDYSVFVHAYPEQWHNDLFGPLTHNTLRNIRFESVDAHGYVNLRCQQNPGCPSAVHPLNPTQADIDNHDIRAYFSDAYQQIFNVSVDKVPGEIGNVCCAQFAVSRDRIRARPKEDYQRILDWAATTKLTDDFGIGWVLEKLWHIIFGMDAVHCPRFEQCRCDTYGWCGPLPSGEMLQAVTKSDH